MKKVKLTESSKFTISQNDEDRLEYVLSAAGEHFKFYQHQVNRYAFWYMSLTALTLVGSALTPLLALLLQNKFWIALPSGLAGLAAAANSAFRLKDEWTENYFAISAIDIEMDRFKGRAAPDYSIEKPLSQAIDSFQTRIGSIVMSEVTLWKQGMKQSSAHVRRTT
jgi:hypothetical protein